MLRIEANPRFRTARVGDAVTFRLFSTDIADLLIPGGVDDVHTNWNVSEAIDSTNKKVVQTSAGGLQLSFTFDRPGKFTIFGSLDLAAGDKRFNGDGSSPRTIAAEYQQNVQPTDSFMWDPVNQERTHVQDPSSAVVALNRYMNTLQSVATLLYVRLDPQAMSLRAQHEAFFKRLEQSAQALHDRLQSTDSWVRIPVDGFHRDNATGQISELKLFLAHPPTQGSTAQWKLVDWSHPGDTRLDGEYDGSGNTDRDAALAALSAFENGNQYPPGAITVTVPAHVLDPTPFVKGFATTGRSFWGTVSDFLSSAAFWLGLLALVLTIAPVPGSQVAAAGIWIGIFSGALGAAAAGLSIYERHARGVSDASHDGLDALTVVACIAGGAGGWARHATLALRLPGAVREFVLVGTVASDSIQGVLVAKDAATAGQNAIDTLVQISKDDTITPAVKVEKLLKLVGQLVVTGAMIYASVKATSRNMAHINEPPPPRPDGTSPPGPPSSELQNAKDPAKTVDLTGKITQTGNTADGSHTTTVEHAPAQAPKTSAGSRAMSLIDQATQFGAASEFDGRPFEVFAHGTSESVASQMVETQGGNLSANAGNFGGQLHTVPDIPVAKIFAERTASKIPGESARVVGIALPRDVVARLRAGPKPLLSLGPIQNPPPGVSPNAQQWVFQRGAIDTLKREGFFFFAN